MPLPLLATRVVTMVTRVALLNVILGTSAKLSIRQQFSDIDTNEDRTLSPQELGGWFTYQDIEYQKRNARELFLMYDKDGNQQVTWDEYAPSSFGTHLDHVCTAIYEGKTPSSSADLDTQVEIAIRTAVRRWKSAGGFSMTLNEFTGFAYPELYQHMRQTLVHETIERFDTDKDGEVSAYEVLNKKYKLNRKQADEFSKGTDSLNDTFLLGLHDTNHDGILDKRELGYWVMENRQLIHRQQSDRIFDMMDTDSNSRISFKEFQNNSHHIKDSIVGFSMKEEL